jgi:hypothetical protein
VNHLERAATIVGTILIGIAAYLIISERKGSASSKPPVDKLAEDLKQAWSEYHSP